MIVNIDSTKQKSKDFKVQFFSIKDGERAIVRFLISSEEDLNKEIILHQVDIGDNKTTRVDCIRDPRQPLTDCPLCAAGVPIDKRMFIKLIQYEKDSNGAFIPKAKIWDRSSKSSVIDNLRTYLNDYGPLTDIVCSITRAGTKLDTTYTISPNLPNQQIYPKDFSDFDDYSILGGVVRSWTADDMNNFLDTGEMPVKKQASVDSSSNLNSMSESKMDGFDDNGVPVWGNNSAINQQTNEDIQRPRRIYNA